MKEIWEERKEVELEGSKGKRNLECMSEIS